MVVVFQEADKEDSLSAETRPRKLGLIPGSCSPTSGRPQVGQACDVWFAPRDRILCGFTSPNPEVARRHGERRAFQVPRHIALGRAIDYRAPEHLPDDLHDAVGAVDGPRFLHLGAALAGAGHSLRGTSESELIRAYRSQKGSAMNITAHPFFGWEFSHGLCSQGTLSARGQTMNLPADGVAILAGAHTAEASR